MEIFSKDCLQPSVNRISIKTLEKYLLSCILTWVRGVSVWPIRSEPFRSRDSSVLVFPVPRHFGQAMKSCRNLIC